MSYDNGNAIGRHGPGRRARRHAPAGGQPITRKPVVYPGRTKWCDKCGHRVGGRIEPCRCPR